MNVVMLDSGEFVEVQGTAEANTYSREQLNLMLDMAEQGINSHIYSQKERKNSISTLCFHFLSVQCNRLNRYKHKRFYTGLDPV